MTSTRCVCGRENSLLTYGLSTTPLQAEIRERLAQVKEQRIQAARAVPPDIAALRALQREAQLLGNQLAQLIYTKR